MGGGLGRSPGVPLTRPAGSSMVAPGQPWGLREDLTEWRAAWGLGYPGRREGGSHPPRSPLWIWLKNKVHLSKFERSVGFIQRFLNLADTKEFRGAVKNERLFEAEGSRTRRLSMVGKWVDHFPLGDRWQGSTRQVTHLSKPFLIF